MIQFFLLHFHYSLRNVQIPNLLIVLITNLPGPLTKGRQCSGYKIQKIWKYRPHLKWVNGHLVFRLIAYETGPAGICLTCSLWTHNTEKQPWVSSARFPVSPVRAGAGSAVGVSGLSVSHRARHTGAGQRHLLITCRIQRLFAPRGEGWSVLTMWHTHRGDNISMWPRLLG